MMTIQTRHALVTVGKGKDATHVVVTGAAKQILELMDSGADSYQQLMDSGVARNSVYMTVKRLMDAGIVRASNVDARTKRLEFADKIHLDPVSLL